jgi:hypothetical protein
MITKKEWDSYSTDKQDELSEDAFSYRECEKCKNYIDLGGQDESKSEGMYLYSYCFDCSDTEIENYEKKHSIDIDDNVFCWKCIKKIEHDLEKGVNNE